MLRGQALRTESQCGQASVELLGSLPAALLLIALAWQFVLTGYTVWNASNAARVGARAAAVGNGPTTAARSALPSYLESGLRVRRSGGEIAVRVQVPILVGRVKSPLTVGARASMERE